METNGTALKSKGKYTITQFPDGFRVEGPDRTPVSVGLRDLRFVMRIESSQESKTFGLISFYSLADEIAAGLMCNWEPPHDKPEPKWTGLKKWAVKQTARAICRHVHQEWKRLLATVPPKFLAVNRAVFAVTLGECSLASNPDLYRNEHLVQDIISHRAAAIAVANAGSLISNAITRDFETSKEVEAAERLAKELGIVFSFHTGANAEHKVPWQQYLPDWQALFSVTGEKYRSLSRTLMNLPGGVPHGMVCRLALVELPRPIVNRLELIATLAASERPRHFSRENPNERTFLFATQDQIAEVVRRVGQATHNPWSHRRCRDVRCVVRYLLDYPDEHHGNIVGLAEKSIRWHRDQIQEETEAMVKNLGADTKTTMPPIPLPNTPGIRLLETVGQIAEEALAMQHCIASYATEAVHGQCYMFHAEHEGDSASVQVSCGGRVVQATGPRNRQNGAARWATRILNRWGADLQEVDNGNGNHAPDPAQMPF